jgi:hypothetical protein
VRCYKINCFNDTIRPFALGVIKDVVHRRKVRDLADLRKRIIESMTPLDFFAWGVIKDVVHRRKVRDLADLRQRIIETADLITPHMLINTWQEREYRLYICRATTGAHIEVYGRA